MSIVNSHNMLLEAAKDKYAIGAFNITDIVEMMAVIETAEEKKSPVIIQTSVKPSKFFKPQVLVSVYTHYATAASVPVALHLDHCSDVEYCKEVAELGYTSIMIDASKQPFSENIAQTFSVASFCHRIGNISTEGELGTVTGVEDDLRISQSDESLANPMQSVEFVERTGIDLFAPAIGTAHGVYKTSNPKVDFDRLAVINNLLNADKVRIPLVVHGGTGLSELYIRELIRSGGAKFNVSTELKHARINATYDYIHTHRDEFDPGKVDAGVKCAIRNVVSKWMDILGSTGKA